MPVISFLPPPPLLYTFQAPVAELPGACYRKIPKSVLKKEKCFYFTIESSIDIKKGQILNKF